MPPQIEAASKVTGTAVATSAAAIMVADARGITSSASIASCGETVIAAVCRLAASSKADQMAARPSLPFEAIVPW